jgi:septal ring factor EnvC (AmiA/AmiB activator)
MMKKFRELSEAIKDKYDIGEYDQEGDMAKSDLRSIIANSKRVHDMLKDDDNLPEWVQSKITKAEDYMSTVANYLESEMNEETGFEKTFRKNTGETYDQYANRRAKEEDERQEQMKKQKEDYIKQGIIKAESVELDEALRHEIAGQVGRFIGNKIDPVHGDIMHAHGKEAYRQAAYHIRKTVNDVKDAVSSLHDRLHKQLRTGGLATEEVET